MGEKDINSYTADDLSPIIIDYRWSASSDYHQSNPKRERPRKEIFLKQKLILDWPVDEYCNASYEEPTIVYEKTEAYVIRIKRLIGWNRYLIAFRAIESRQVGFWFKDGNDAFGEGVITKAEIVSILKNYNLRLEDQEGFENLDSLSLFAW